MSDRETAHDDSLTPADLEQVIALRERFEQAWKQGRAPRMEELLGPAPEHLHPRLRRELCALEVELRAAQGGSLGQDAYRNLSSDLTGSIDAIFPSVVDTGPRLTQVEDPEGVAVTSELGTRTWMRASDSVENTDPDQDLAGKATASLAASPSEATRPHSTAGSWHGVSDDGYEILSTIGHGAMGVVLKARHRRLNRVVALKLLRDGLHARPDLLVRLRIEAEALASLRHENIVQVYDVGELEGDPFVALEYLDGGTLAAKLNGTPQTDHLAAEMSLTLARAIHAAHQAGIIHRDLKPLNVLLDQSGRLKVADFGLAKRVDDESGQTHSGQIMGTPCYMSPEQARGEVKAIGPAADVYALGAILYEMLTGRPPFKGPTPHETVRQVIHDEPVQPSRLHSRVSRDLETICLKCLAKEPHRRYVSAADLADDLERYLDGRPILARRTPIWEQGVKWARRHPTTTALTALGLAAFLSLVATGVWYQDHLRRLDKADGQHLAVRLSEGTSKLLKGQDELAKGRFDEAKLTLSNLMTGIKDEPRRLADLHRRATALLVQADAAIDREKADVAQRFAVEQARERYRRFRTEKDSALYHETQFANLDPSASRDATRTAAKAALAVFGTPTADDEWSLDPLPGSLSEAEERDVEEGCYVLLLILAGVEDQPAQSLHRLDSAAKLRSPTWSYQRRLADCLARRGDGDGAETARLAAESLKPDTAFDFFLTGLDRYRRQEWAAALGDFDAALRLQPDHFWSHALSAICCLQPELRRPEQAKVHLFAALQREPGFAWLYVLRGFASYQTAVLTRDTSPDLASRGETASTQTESSFKPAEDDYRKAEALLAATPNAELRYVLLVNRGLLRLERRDWSGAVSDLEEAIRRDSRHYLAYANLALVYQRQGKPDEAVAEFGRAITVRSDMAALYRGRADVEINRKEPTSEQRARAIRDLDQAIRLETPGKPVLARDQTSRALLFYEDGRDKDVLAACDAALAIVPNHAPAHLLRVRALLRLRRYNDAMQSCDVLLAHGKPSSEVYKFRQLTREKLDDFAGAIEDVTQTLSLRPGQPDVLAHRGELYLIENSPQLAVRDFEEAVKLDPKNAEARAGLGNARVRLGKYREAVADAEAAARLGPTDHRVLYKAARVYALAAVAANSEIRRKGNVALLAVERYQDRAVALVLEARGKVPAAERATFETALRADPALNTIRRRVLSTHPPGSGVQAAK